jgi:16S rRNA (uracil1498-N3)-methyltransferase
MRRFYAAPEQFQQSEIDLSLEESRHLRDVLRLREGDEVSVFDGEGKEYLCRISETGHGKHLSKLKMLEEIRPISPESPLELTLAIALLKGEKFDLVIQKATELGVSRIIPLQTARSDVKIKSPDDAAKKLERWRRVALEAVKQCGRAKIPELLPPTPFPNFIETSIGRKILFSERGGESWKEIAGSKSPDIKVVGIVGPEGGWEEDEIRAARNRAFSIATLNGRVLRAETAGITVCVLLQNLFGDLN